MSEVFDQCEVNHEQVAFEFIDLTWKKMAPSDGFEDISFLNKAVRYPKFHFEQLVNPLALLSYHIILLITATVANGRAWSPYKVEGGLCLHVQDNAAV